MTGASTGEPRQGRLFLLALALAALAGWVDAIGFTRWSGTFVSFMSGNTTQVGVALGSGLAVKGLQPGMVIGAFVAGVVAGEVLGMLAGRRRRPLVLLAETCLLGAAALTSPASKLGDVTLVLLGSAMGVQNAAIHRADRIGVALTYVTGTLVHLGQATASALLGHDSWKTTAPFAALWVCLGAGAVLGGVVGARFEQGALATAAAASAALGLAALVLERGPDTSPAR